MILFILFIYRLPNIYLLAHILYNLIFNYFFQGIGSVSFSSLDCCEAVFLIRSNFSLSFRETISFDEKQGLAQILACYNLKKKSLFYKVLLRVEPS